MTKTSTLVPLLVVRGARAAIDFYERVLGATVTACREHEGRVSHADLVVGDTAFAITEEARVWNSDAPPSLGGSPVVLQLHVTDAEVAFRALADAGAEIVFPIQAFLGERMGRVRDPFGHLWLVREGAAQGSSTLRNGEGPRQGLLHLVLGPVGAGKSTYAAGLSTKTRAVRLTLDDWFVTLFSPDRPEHGVPEWYRERAERAVEQIWKVTLSVLETGADAILEVGLLRRDQRERFYDRARRMNVSLRIHVLEADRDVRRERVLERNRTRGDTFSMIVPPSVFEYASDLWEPVEKEESEGFEVRRVRTD